MAIRIDALNGVGNYAPVSSINPVYSAWTNAPVDEKSNLTLAEIIKLMNVEKNKFSILWLLQRADWTQLLNLMPKDQLVNGLQFFDRDKLLGLMMQQPPKFIMNMIYALFTPAKLVKKMPLSDLMHILRAPQLDNRALITHMQDMDPRFLKQLLVNIFGMSAAQAERMKPADMWSLFFHTPKRRMMDGFKTLPYEALQPFVTGFLDKEKELLGFVSGAFVDRVFDGMGKGDPMEACCVLPEDRLINMLCQLPDKFLVQVADQIDDYVFMDYLMTNQSTLLRSLAGQ